MAAGLFAVPTRFELVRELGRGGMGVVFEAVDHDFGVHVALKTLQRLDGDSLYRFKEEFRVLQGIHHSSLVRLGELIEAEGQWFFTMELVRGVDFLAHARGLDAPHVGSGPLTRSGELAPTERLDPSSPSHPGARAADGPAPGRLDPTRLRETTAQLAGALATLHGAGKVHRDLKPKNVLVAGGRVVVLDFGLVASAAAPDLEPDGTILGTPGYMAPEQAEGRAATPASDWYSVGVMLYQALTGWLPHGAAGTGDASALVVPSWRAEGVPADLDALCVALLERDPERRPDAREVLRRLGRGGAEPRAGGEAAFVGRSDELARLDAALAGCRPGRPGAAFVHGGSGMGKSALLDRFAEGQRARGAQLLAGRCYERESVPYKALDGVVDALMRRLAELPPHEVAAILPPDVRALARIFPVLERIEPIARAPGRGAPAAEPRELRRSAFAALKALLARLADRAPLAVIIDDLQWGDADSAAFLAYVLRPPAAPGLLVLAAYRAEEAAQSLVVGGLRRAAARALGPEALVDVPVGPLGEAEARALAQALLGDGGDAAPLAAETARQAQGSPFLIGEVIRWRRHAGGGGAPAPAAVDEIVAARRARLPAAAVRLLDALAVAGRPIPQAVALRAAEVPPDERHVLDELRAERFIRTRGPGPRDAAEIYHDRVREALVARTGEDDARELHRRLARAVEAEGLADPELHADLLAGAGERERAAARALDAAAHAEHALAFTRAARFLRMALDLHADGGDRAARRGLRRRLGDALASADLGVEAACAYRAAAANAPSGEALELRRLAAAQLLRSGRIDDGVAELRDVLGSVGMTMPARPSAALASLLRRRAELRLRGYRFRRAAAPAADDAAARIHACFTAATGLGMVDPVRAADFGTRYLLLALRAGDPAHVARGLALETWHVATGGGAAERRAAAIIAAAEALARDLHDPHLDGLVSLASGAAAELCGHWRAARAHCERAEATLRERCRGVAWELATAETFGLTATYYMGDFAALAARVPALQHEALERNDLYTAAGLTSFAAYTRLLQDDIAGARAQVAHAAVPWSVRGYHVQRFLGLVTALQIDFYEGDGAAAWRRIESEWRALRSSLLRHVQFLRIEISHARARAALATGDPALLRIAEAEAKAIERARMAWADPLAQLVRAAAAASRGQREPAAALLAEAAAALDRAEMAGFAAAARRRRGELLGGDEGAACVAAADAFFAAQGARRPAAFARMLAPGF